MNERNRPPPEAVEAALSAFRPLENDEDAMLFHSIVQNIGLAGILAAQSTKRTNLDV
jgi:hypothetical protein